jgi:hypothetical protein
MRPCLFSRNLHDLALMSGESADFSFRMRALHDEHARKPSLLEKFRKAKLLGGYRPSG